MSEANKSRSSRAGALALGNPTEQNVALDTRRDFFGRALAAASVLAFGKILSAPEAQAQGTCQSTPGDELLDMLDGALKSVNGTLQGIVRMTNETRAVPVPPCINFMLRYFEGWDASGKKTWPPANRKGLPTPGPTLVASIGDHVQLAFLNNVNPRDFPGTIDTGHLSNDAPAAGCDAAATTGQSNSLPALDTYPNCFHGSNACNLHFHGTHVTPSGFGDNVLVMVEPANVQPNDPVYTGPFAEIFANCSKYAIGDVDWKTAVPKSWQDKQDSLLQEYDSTTQFRGQRGLPPEVALYQQNQKAMGHGEWPPYHMGAFPNCFQITPSPAPGNSFKMGQAPGTHWYHAHKHGSTAMHLLHGLAGAMILRGQYDQDLRTLYPNLRERILVIQEISDMPALYRNGNSKAVLLNGQYQPKITMAQGEIQLWRIVNAAQQGQMPFSLNTQFKQIAQDGVQFHPVNYDRQAISANISLFPGNRIDLLVKAPPSGTNGQLLINGNTVLATIALNGSVSEMNFPDPKKYPIQFPGWLKDITDADIRKSRRLTFGWDTSMGGNPDGTPKGTGRNPNSNAPPHFMIDNKQFDPEVIDQTMELDDYEEWMIENTTTIPHPFHIHVNPFQVVEVFDPSVSSMPVKIPAPFVWWDTFAIPANGYFKMRSHFTDFTGKFVLHCHILGHEDRGMMQVVQVVPKPHLNVPHH